MSQHKEPSTYRMIDLNFESNWQILMDVLKAEESLSRLGVVQIKKESDCYRDFEMPSDLEAFLKVFSCLARSDAERRAIESKKLTPLYRKREVAALRRRADMLERNTPL